MPRACASRPATRRSCAAARRRCAATRPSPIACITGCARRGFPRPRCRSSPPTDRAAVGHLIADEKHVDVIVPRGGKSLIERIAREARVPVIKHLDGVCHVFIDASRRPRHGDPHRRQREDAALLAVQHDGDAARARGHRGARPAGAVRHLPAQGRRAARRRSRARAGAGDEARRPRTTGTPSTWRRSLRSASWTRSTRRSRTSRSTARSTRTRS